MATHVNSGLSSPAKVLLLLLSLISWSRLVVVIEANKDLGINTRTLNNKKHRYHGKFMPGVWKSAYATFYGGSDGSETTCRYIN